MSIKTLSRKEQWAKDIAYCIIEAEETDVTPGDIDRWASWDLYEWLEAWGYEWYEDDQEWIFGE